MKYPLIAILAFIFSALFNQAQAAPITFNTALPVSKGQSIIREQFIYSQASNANTELTQASFITSAVHGISANTTLFATIPLSYSSLETSEQRSSDFGSGDLEIFIRHTVFQQNSPGKTFRISPFAGVELATSNLDFGNSSNDVFAGFVATYATTDWTADGQISYQKNGRDGELNIGDTISFDASLQYRLIPRKLTATTSAYLNGVIELNVVKQNSNSNKQGTVDGSDGTLVFLSPGVQYITQRWIAEAIVQLPVTNNNNPLENDFIARAGVRINF